MSLAAPHANRQLRVIADLPHCIGQQLKLGLVNVDPAEHREQLLFVMVIHLDFRDPRPACGDMVNDRVGQTDVVRAQGGDDDFHEKSSKQTRTAAKWCNPQRPENPAQWMGNAILFRLQAILPTPRLFG